MEERNIGLLFVVVWLLLAWATGKLGERKGLSMGLCFVLGFLFNPFVAIVLLCLRNTQDRVPCRTCCELIVKYARICHFCGTPQRTAPTRNVRVPVMRRRNNPPGNNLTSK